MIPQKQIIFGTHKMLRTGRNIITSFPAWLLYRSKYGRVDILVEGNE